MVWQDRPAVGQMLKHPTVPPCHTHAKCEPPHSLHPAPLYHSTLLLNISNVSVRLVENPNHFPKDAVVVEICLCLKYVFELVR